MPEQITADPSKRLPVPLPVLAILTERTQLTSPRAVFEEKFTPNLRNGTADDGSMEYPLNGPISFIYGGSCNHCSFLRAVYKEEFTPNLRHVIKEKRTTTRTDAAIFVEILHTKIRIIDRTCLTPRRSSACSCCQARTRACDTCGTDTTLPPTSCVAGGIHLVEMVPLAMDQWHTPSMVHTSLARTNLRGATSFYQSATQL